MTDILFPIPVPADERIDELIAEVKCNRSRAAATARVDLSKLLKHYGDQVPVVTFNYYGSHSTTQDSDVFDPVDLGEILADEDPANRRSAALDLGCGQDGVLRTSVIYSASIHQEREAQRLLHL